MNKNQHAIEKILARASDRPSVSTGEIVECRVDLAEVNDIYPQTIRSFYDLGGKKVYNPDRVTFILDHYAPAATIQQAEIQKQMRQFCRDQGIKMLFDIGSGVCHQVMVDEGLVYPGMILVATDSHTTTHGALGAFGTGVGATDLAVIMRTGKLWFRVPEVVLIELKGTIPKGVFAKDIILFIIGNLGADYAIYKVVEFCGAVIKDLSVSERMALCNMTTEMGAKASYIQPDETTFEFLRQKVHNDYQVFESDPNYDYSANLSYDVSKITPQLSVPHSVDNVEPISHFEGLSVDQAYLGSCTGGRTEDFEVAARILDGKKVHPRTRFVAVPASKNVYLESLELGYIDTLVRAGATVVTPGCAACLGTHSGIIASGEVCISSTNRNFPGRMGHTGAKIYLGSPAAVAASAIEGKIVNPANYLDIG